MNDETRLDDELAAFTDKLLAGEDVHAAPEIEDLAAVVRQVHDLVAPDSRPDPAVRERLARQLRREWTQQEAARPESTHHAHSPPGPTRASHGTGRFAPPSAPRLRSAISGLRRNRIAQLAALAAIVTVVLLVALLLAADSSAISGEEGTVSGVFSWPVIVGIVVVGLIILWLGKRSRS
jgi:hypothetical protein